MTELKTLKDIEEEHSWPDCKAEDITDASVDEILDNLGSKAIRRIVQPLFTKSGKINVVYYNALQKLQSNKIVTKPKAIDRVYREA